MSPNVHTKKFWSHALNRHFEISVTMKAYRCINKKGGLDNYLLKTDPRDIRSRFGETLRVHIEKKLADPEYVVPYIQGTYKLRRNQLKKDELKNRVIWKPPETRFKDFTHEEFDRYDPNAPPRPDPIREKVNLKEIEEELTKADRNFDINSDPATKEFYEGIDKEIAIDPSHKDKPRIREKKKRGMSKKKERVKKEKILSGKGPIKEGVIMSRIREKILGLKDK